MTKVKILWADDEIDLLKPHIMFLESKGYDLTTVNSGNDAVDEVEENYFDIVFLDENMPGISGLEALQKIKELDHTLPVIMITKSEEESIMEEAIGSQISDYLIKPVNPNQILLSVKKNLDNKRLVSEKTNSSYQQKFRDISMKLMNRLDKDEWKDIHKELIHWDMELQKTTDDGMSEILDAQKNEANHLFSKFIKSNYLSWLNDTEEAPVMSHTLIQKKVFPILKNTNKPLYLVVIDNLRFDQWKMLQPEFSQRFRVEEEDIYYSILPTATQYARNAIFAGLMPSEIEKIYPDLWKNEDDEGSKNMHEKELLKKQLVRNGLDIPFSYNKITNLRAGKKLADNFKQLGNNKLNVIVYNFVDMLSHARTDMEVIKELADDEAAYRSLTKSWFEHSPLLEIFKKIADTGADVMITTDHGTMRVQTPVKVIGDRNTNTNLRYKIGKNLNYNAKEVFEITKPAEAFLPKINVSSKYIFTLGDSYFVYPNNQNYYTNFYRNTFQHGGISMEEILIPIIHLHAK